MQTFQFQLSNDHLKVPIQQPFFLNIEYSADNNKVLLLDFNIPPCLFPYIKDNYALHDQIFHAAENNYAGYKAAQDEHQFDIYKELGKFFNPNPVQP